MAKLSGNEKGVALFVFSSSTLYVRDDVRLTPIGPRQIHHAISQPSPKSIFSKCLKISWFSGVLSTNLAA
jgi:hypothetical protein